MLNQNWAKYCLLNMNNSISQIGIGTGPVKTAVFGRLIPKWDIYGVPVTHATLIMDEVKGDEVIIFRERFPVLI